MKTLVNIAIVLELLMSIVVSAVVIGFFGFIAFAGAKAAAKWTRNLFNKKPVQAAA